MFLFYYRHRGPHSATSHIVSYTGRRFLLDLDRKNRFLVNRFRSSVKKRQ